MSVEVNFNRSAAFAAAKNGWLIATKSGKRVVRIVFDNKGHKNHPVFAEFENGTVAAYTLSGKIVYDINNDQERIVIHHPGYKAGEKRIIQDNKTIIEEK